MKVCAMCGQISPYCKFHEELDVYLCPDCYEKVERHHGKDGKFVVREKKILNFKLDEIIEKVNDFKFVLS